MCPGPWARNGQGLNEKQHSHRYGYVKIFNAGLLKIAKNAQQQLGRKTKSDFSFSLTTISTMIIYLRKKLSLLSFKQILDRSFVIFPQVPLHFFFSIYSFCWSDWVTSLVHCFFVLLIPFFC